MVKRFIYIILFVLFLCSMCFAQHEYDYYTNDNIKVAWDAVSNAVGYDWQVRRLNETTAYIIGSGSATNVIFKISSAGKYIFYCNAWNYKEDGIIKQYSNWATSLTAGRVDGVEQPWIIVVKLKPVGPLKVGPLMFSDE